MLVKFSNDLPSSCRSLCPSSSLYDLFPRLRHFPHIRPLPFPKYNSEHTLLRGTPHPLVRRLLTRLVVPRCISTKAEEIRLSESWPQQVALVDSACLSVLCYRISSPTSHPPLGALGLVRTCFMGHLWGEVSIMAFTQPT